MAKKGTGLLGGFNLNNPKGVIGAQTALNRFNEYTPEGSQTWTQGPNGQYTRNIRLSGDSKGLLGSLTSAAKGLLGGMSTGDMTDQMYQSYKARLDPQFAQQQDALQQSLANRGVPMDSQLYNTQNREFRQSQSDAYRDALTQAISSAGTEALKRSQAASYLLPQRQAMMQGGFSQPAQIDAAGPATAWANMANQLKQAKIGAGPAQPNFFERLAAETQAAAYLQQIQNGSKPQAPGLFSQIAGGIGSGIAGGIGKGIGSRVAKGGLGSLFDF